MSQILLLLVGNKVVNILKNAEERSSVSPGQTTGQRSSGRRHRGGRKKAKNAVSDEQYGLESVVLAPVATQRIRVVRNTLWHLTTSLVAGTLL